MVEVRQLRHFLAVAEVGTFTGAAGRLHISQPGLSASIRGLERRLDVVLFVRGRRRAELTEAGRELYPTARRAVATVDTVETQVRGRHALARSTLRIGAVPSFAGLDLAALVSRLTAEHPDVDVEITVGMPRILFAALDSEAIELAFVTMQLDAPESLTLTPIATYPMMLACPLGHRLAQRRSVGLDDLADESFVEFGLDQPSRQVADRAFAALRVPRTSRVTCNEIASVLELVAHGVGVAIVPRPLAIATHVPVALVTLEDDSLTWAMALGTRTNAEVSEAARAMRRLIPGASR